MKGWLYRLRLSPHDLETPLQTYPEQHSANILEITYSTIENKYHRLSGCLSS